MMRLLVNTPQNTHEIIAIGEGGGYFDDARVIWDERISGPIPDEMVAAVEQEAIDRIPVPQSVPMLNAHLALIGAGWMPGVRFYMNSLTGTEGEQARAYFDKALTCRRDHPLVQNLAIVLRKTSAEVDALFIAAAKLD